MKKFTLVLFFSIAFYCGKAQESFIGKSKNEIEAFFTGDDITIAKSYDNQHYEMVVYHEEEGCSTTRLEFTIHKNSRKCSLVVWYPNDYRPAIKRLNNAYGVPVNGYWVGVNNLGEKVKIRFVKSNPDEGSFWYSYL